jgi:cytochrome P450
MDTATIPFVPPHVAPRVPRPRRLAFVAALVRNSLEVLPASAYREDFVAVPSARLPRAWVTSPALIKAVLLDERDKFRKLTQIRLLGPLLGRGLLTSEDADWKWQRQAAAPLFRPQELASFVPAFVRCAERAAARWRANAGDGVRSMEAEMNRLTLEIVAETLLPGGDEEFMATLQRSVAGLQRSGGWDIFYASMNVPRWVPRPGMRRSRREARRMQEAVALRLQAHRASHGADDDLVARLVAARDPETGRAMDAARIVDNLLTFYLAGHETTAKAIAWTLYLLTRSPAWTAALVEEIEAVTGGSAIEAAHLERLERVQQVVKESMRLYPPVPMMSRQAVADVKLGDRTVVAGTSVLIPIYAIHRHTTRWDRPHEFDPARFEAARERAIPRYQYMPFGAGPRICIGMSFAMMEATAVIATLLQQVRFTWAGQEEPLPIARVTLVPKGGMPMRVAPRG